MRLTATLPLVFATALTLGACSERTQDNAAATAESAADDAARNADRAGDAAANSTDRAGDALERAGDATADAARDAGSAVKDALENAGRAGDAAFETFDVKAALTADSRISANGINVDTNHETKTVVLKGIVPTASQKTIAGQIAADQAKGYNVRNDLTVRN
jgi:hypothetical protein